VHLDVAGAAGQLAQDQVTAALGSGPAGQHHLRDVMLARVRRQGRRWGAGQDGELTAELCGQRRVPCQQLLGVRWGRRRRHDGDPELPGEPGGQRGRPPDQRLHPGPWRRAAQDARRGLAAGRRGAVPVGGQLPVGVFGHDGEGLLAERAERLGSVIGLQRAADLAGRDDLAPAHPVGEFGRRSVHQLDLVGESQGRGLIRGAAGGGGTGGGGDGLQVG
jgi:hypothetical protein